MTIILHDHAQTIRVGHVPTAVVLDLAASLPAHVRLRVQPDEDEDEYTPERPHEPGYFGLAVALARRTWEG